MASFTKKITVNGWTLLSTALIAAGYTGTNALSVVELLNDNATTVYIHLTNTGLANPATGTDGVPIGTGAPSLEWGFEQHAEDFLDAGTTWLYSASSVDIKAAGVGGGI